MYELCPRPTPRFDQIKEKGSIMKERIRIGLCYFGEGEGNGAPNGQAAEASTNTAAEKRVAEDVDPYGGERVARGKGRVAEVAKRRHGSE